MDEPLLASAGDAARALRRGEVSSGDLTRLLLERIDALNPTLNAVVELRREAALRDAAAADEATARGAAAGPLHGVPMTVKESFSVAGMHTTWGDPAAKDFVADADATVVRRLRRAGARGVRKTNPALILADLGPTPHEPFG